MTKPTHFIAGDWGTSNLRLYLCQHKASGQSQILDTQFGPGISQINNNFEETFFNICNDWLTQHGAMPVLLSGMVGSTIGWKDAPYLDCPVNAQDIAKGRVTFRARGLEFSILAGLRTQNPLGMPDVMRGEELQMLGWLAQQKTTPKSQLFALPGTHNKWTLVEDGTIQNFLTAFTGELFAILKNHSILITDQSKEDLNEDAFLSGVQAAEKMAEAQLLHSLFSTRSQQVLGLMPSADAPSYLSGLIIGSDVKGARNVFSNINSVTVIADPRLCQLYDLSLQHFGVECRTCDPAEIAISGFETIYQHLSINT